MKASTQRRSEEGSTGLAHVHYKLKKVRSSATNKEEEQVKFDEFRHLIGLLIKHLNKLNNSSNCHVHFVGKTTTNYVSTKQINFNMEPNRPLDKKGRTLLSFFTKSDKSESTPTPTVPNTPITTPTPTVPSPPIVSPEIERSSPFNVELEPSDSIEQDPGKRKQIYEYPFNERDQIRRAYLKVGPYQQNFSSIKAKNMENRNVNFKSIGTISILGWSIHLQHIRHIIFSASFSSMKVFHLIFHHWLLLDLIVGRGLAKEVNVHFFVHIGTTSSSYHNGCEGRAEDLMKPTQHIDKVIHAVSSEEKQKNHLHLMTTIMSVRWLALQSCLFRGNDESPSSLNRGNVLEMVDAFGKMNTKIGEVVLGNAPKNATYTSPDIQKEILSIMANRVRQRIRKEIGDAKFSILVNVARDASSQEQMAIILRFVNGTRWSSYYNSVKSLIDIYAVTYKVLEYLSDHSPNNVGNHGCALSSPSEKNSRHFNCYEICPYYKNYHSRIERRSLGRIS
ncbi:uncharacterized protein LOC111409504 [Olea europaea var. sylvestris]|uniref:uncharacterized protein LOC111409504 n=1 Tax=Olea europaea var. sylvestris TaxID=158386 RepID=UPI000C1D1BE7|nr:uncharacterized protein LOC111409504 [Olea europaea var. sylvestris]